MHVAHLTLRDFRSYRELDLPLEPGVCAFVGLNGQGKTNLVEAIDYLSRLSSHRVASDTPLVRAGAERGLVRAAVVRDGRTATLEVELVPGKANRARINRAPLPRTRDLIGLVRTVIFSPDDLALVKGDPSDRRRFLDDHAILRSPRLVGTRADYDRVLRQRNTLLKTIRAASQRSAREAAEATLAAWDEQLVAAGAELVAARLDLVEQLVPYVASAYAAVALGATRQTAHIGYRGSFPLDAGPDRAALAAAMTETLAQRRREEYDRAVTLVGPHRDELELTLGPAPLVEDGAPAPVTRPGDPMDPMDPPSPPGLPVKGYASHGESWSFALALKLAAYELLRAEADEPILILDDVFAELDAERRRHLADLVAGAQQVLVTAAVPDDVPEVLSGTRYRVAEGAVSRD